MFQIEGANVVRVKLRSEDNTPLGEVIWDDEDKRYLFDPAPNWWFEAAELRQVADAMDKMNERQQEKGQ